MNCFHEIGMKVPATLTARQRQRGGALCPCGELVRFDIVTKRAAHFLVCPKVDEIVNEAQAPLTPDRAALEAGLRYFGPR